MQVVVLGSPRTGTTLLGNFIASHPACLDLGEFYGFYLALSQAPTLMKRMPSPVKVDYLSDLATSARDFANRLLKSSGGLFWCDQTPWNLLVARDLARLLPEALFVLTLRDFRGAVLSLRRSYAKGYQWAGFQLTDSAKLWAAFYRNAPALPTERTLVVSYDALCCDPEKTILQLESDVAFRLGIQPDGFDRRVLAIGHAQSSPSDRKIAVQRGERIEFRSIEPYNMLEWTDGMEAECAYHVEEVDAILREHYGRCYVSSTRVATSR